MLQSHATKGTSKSLALEIHEALSSVAGVRLLGHSTDDAIDETTDETTNLLLIIRTFKAHSLYVYDNGFKYFTSEGQMTAQELAEILESDPRAIRHIAYTYVVVPEPGTYLIKDEEVTFAKAGVKTQDIICIEF